MIKRLLIPLALILTLIHIPAKANSCGIPFLEEGIKKTGTLNVQILFVKYPDSPKKSKSYIKDYLSMMDLEYTTNYFKQASYGKSKIKFRINNSWINMPNNSFDYRMHVSFEKDWREIEQNYFKAVLYASDSKIDYSKSDIVFIVSDPDLFQTYVQLRDPQIADGKSLKAIVLNQTNAPMTTHELLHTLGLKDLYESRDIWGPKGGMEQYSIMSQFYGGTNLTGFEKYSLGWLGSKDFVCQESGSSTYKLSSLDNKGLKLVMVPINSQEILAIEYRKNEKVDKYLGSTGYLVYHVRSNVQGNVGSTGSPMIPIFFGKKGTVNFQGINVDLKKNSITVSK